MFGFFNKKKEIKEQEQKLDKAEVKGYKAVDCIALNIHGKPYTYGGKVAEEYLRKSVIDYLKAKTGYVILNSDVLLEPYLISPMHNSFEQVRIIVKCTDYKICEELKDPLKNFTELFIILHYHQKVLKPILSLNVLNCEKTGYVGGFIKFEDLPDFKNNFKHIRYSAMNEFFNEFKYALSCQDCLASFEDAKSDKLYTPIFELVKDEGFMWHIFFYEQEPLDLSIDYENLVKDIANDLVCSEYFIPKIK